MQKQITVKSEYNTLDSMLDFLMKETTYECSKEYDSWDVRTDSNGQMEQCIVIKKSLMHGMKVYFNGENTLVMTYLIPNKIMNAYFGKSQKRYKNILEIITGKVSQALLAGAQETAFQEIEQGFKKVTV